MFKHRLARALAEGISLAGDKLKFSDADLPGDLIRFNDVPSRYGVRPMPGNTELRILYSFATTSSDPHDEYLDTTIQKINANIRAAMPTMADLAISIIYGKSEDHANSTATRLNKMLLLMMLYKAETLGSSTAVDIAEPEQRAEKVPLLQSTKASEIRKVARHLRKNSDEARDSGGAINAPVLFDSLIELVKPSSHLIDLYEKATKKKVDKGFESISKDILDLYKKLVLTPERLYSELNVNEKFRTLDRLSKVVGSARVEYIADSLADFAGTLDDIANSISQLERAGMPQGGIETYEKVNQNDLLRSEQFKKLFNYLDRIDSDVAKAFAAIFISLRSDGGLDEDTALVSSIETLINTSEDSVPVFALWFKGDTTILGSRQNSQSFQKNLRKLYRIGKNVKQAILAELPAGIIDGNAGMKETTKTILQLMTGDYNGVSKILSGDHDFPEDKKNVRRRSGVQVVQKIKDPIGPDDEVIVDNFIKMSVERLAKVIDLSTIDLILCAGSSSLFNTMVADAVITMGGGKRPREVEVRKKSAEAFLLDNFGVAELPANYTDPEAWATPTGDASFEEMKASRMYKYLQAKLEKGKQPRQLVATHQITTDGALVEIDPIQVTGIVTSEVMARWVSRQPNSQVYIAKQKTTSRELDRKIISSYGSGIINESNEMYFRRVIKFLQVFCSVAGKTSRETDDILLNGLDFLAGFRAPQMKKVQDPDARLQLKMFNDDFDIEGAKEVLVIDDNIASGASLLDIGKTVLQKMRDAGTKTNITLFSPLRMHT